MKPEPDEDYQLSAVPRHLGLILDGNRRWAKAHGLPNFDGHRRGYENLKTIAQAAFDAEVEYVSAYIFSTENWNRTKEEVSYLMDLAVKMAETDLKELIENNIKIVVLGVEDGVSKKVMSAWRTAERDSAQNTGGVLALCFNYGGLREITDAVRSIIASGIAEDDISEDLVASNLYHSELPQLDLVIRTSGEQRISNFMLARIGYSELIFVTQPWPAFTVEDLRDSFEEYSRRQRRYGK